MTTARLIGRRREQAILSEAQRSSEAELVAIYGRRRVGKTFLVRAFFDSAIVFELIGAHDAPVAQQLRTFASALGRTINSPAQLAAPPDWQIAFEQLRAALEPRLLDAGPKLVVFLDELPWLASRRSGFLTALEHFWNSWASRQSRLLVVMCGSAASWMLEKVVRQRGGLHNRVTRRIRLTPFSLGEAEAYLRSRQVRLDRYSMLELYMAVGGVPHYLKEMRPTESVAQCIDRTCFASDGLLRDEFDNLYAALFHKSIRHEGLVRALAKQRSGLTRQQLVAATSLTSGGAISKVLFELEECGFIARIPQLGRTKKDARYRLSDPYTRFYLSWIDGGRGRGAGTWIKKRAKPVWRAWCGLTFEAICLDHVQGIKRALGIEAVDTEAAAWIHRGSGDGHEGAQVDLVIDRADRTINLCEMKFAASEFAVSADYGRELERKRRVFQRATETRKTLLLTLVTTYGLKPNEHTRRLGLGVVTMDALFEA